MGRFINEDTYEGQIDNPLSLNLYTYVHNNPLKYVDPSGNIPAKPLYCYNDLCRQDKAEFHELQMENQQKKMDTLKVLFDNLVNSAPPQLSAPAIGTKSALMALGLYFKSLGKNKGTYFMGGRAGEKYLAAIVGGVAKPVTFRTSKGIRFVDVLVDDIAHESKVGFTELTPFIKKQILKDAELLKNGDIEGVKWHFFKSEISGKGGANQKVYDFLKENGIEYILHF